jgi:hypothetical protein
VTFYEFTLNRSLSVLRDRALAFERLLVHRFVFQRLETWSDLINSSHVITALSVSLKHLISGVKSGAAFDPYERLQELGSFAEGALIRQVSFTIRAELIFNGFRQEQEADFTRLRDIWKLVLDECLEEKAIPTAMKKPQMTAALMKVMAMRNILGTVHVVSFYRRYFRIMEVLRVLAFMEMSFALPDASLLRYAVTLSAPDDPDNRFLETVLGISALLLHTVDFVMEIGKESNHQWHRFEEVVICLVDKHKELAELYYGISEKLLSLL